MRRNEMERRIFLGALTGASLGALVEGVLTEPARAQNPTERSSRSSLQFSFETSEVKVSGNTIFVRRYGKGPAILMVQAFPVQA
jgi:haloacetate dehalogenase